MFTSYFKTKKPSERGESTAVVLVIFLIMLVIGSIIFVAVRDEAFDNSVKENRIQINGAEILLNNNGHPLSDSNLSTKVPYSSDEITYKVRKYEIADCEVFELVEDAVGVKAVTAFPSPELIDISVSLRPSGGIVVCVPEGSEIEVVLWAIK